MVKAVTVGEALMRPCGGSASDPVCARAPFLMQLHCHQYRCGDAPDRRTGVGRQWQHGRRNQGCVQCALRPAVCSQAHACAHATLPRAQLPRRGANCACPPSIPGSTKREPTVVGKPSDFMLANIAGALLLPLLT